MLRGICKKENFLDLFENFILYDHSGGHTAKILARNHQYLGVNEAMKAYAARKLNDGKLGVFWYTQGSGKSYSMVFLAQKVRRKFEGSPTFVTYLKEVLTKFRDYMWNELESTGKDWLLAIEKFEGLHSVPIMTIHKSKGLEYDAVYFVGLEDSAFWSFKNQSEEDRCAFFVALSRAKKEIFFTFCQYRYTSRFPKQKHDDINEFFELLKIPGMANIIE